MKANRGAAGIDEETIAMFEQNLSRNLYKLWNRMSSGSYFPPPVKQVEIPKAKGGTRKLGIPTVSDRIAQTVVKLIIEPILDPIFHPDSYGYRPGRSAKQAIAVTRKRCWQYDWVVEFDIKAAFDQIDHGLLMKAVRSHIKEGWILLYIERWLTAPFETADGERLPRERGTPQGGVVSPILMNLFMHYAFDGWMKRTYPPCPFARYADDAVVHCRTQKQAEEVMRSIALRLAECGLTMHPEKSKDRVLQGQQPDRILSECELHVPGLYVSSEEGRSTVRRRAFTSFLPGVSRDALKRMRQTCGGGALHRQTSGRWSNWHSNTIRRYVAGGTTTGRSIGRRCSGSVDISTEARAVGQAQVQNTVAAQAAQCGVAAQDEEGNPADVRPLAVSLGTGWIMGAV